MREVKSSIWSDEWKDYWRVIPINTTLKTDGSLVMGAGLTKQAAERYPILPRLWGKFFLNEGYGYTGIECWRLQVPFLISFPTKIHWQQAANLSLIEENLEQLHDAMQTEFEFRLKSKNVVCPRLGCGFGQLDWVKDVKPLMLKYFDTNDNFIIVSL